MTALRRTLQTGGLADIRTPSKAQFAAIAQLVEHVIRNDGVGGSNPSCGTSLRSLRELRLGKPALHFVAYLRHG